MVADLKRNVLEHVTLWELMFLELWNFELKQSLTNRLLMDDGSWLMAQGSWLKAPGSWSSETWR